MSFSSLKISQISRSTSRIFQRQRSPSAAVQDLQHFYKIFHDPQPQRNKNQHSIKREANLPQSTQKKTTFKETIKPNSPRRKKELPAGGGGRN
ncbi:hypothetical protein Droror1_Dr00005671 [Drosera rotundifolia]